MRKIAEQRKHKSAPPEEGGERVDESNGRFTFKPGHKQQKNICDAKRYYVSFRDFR